MILGHDAILAALEAGDIRISPWSLEQVNTNSVNLHLHHELVYYENPTLDMAIDNPTKRFTIPEAGTFLQPGVLYLGRTQEWTESHKYVPMIEGRSSTGRLGLDIHVSAGFGDLGFCGYFTLELRVVQPLRIYPGVSVAQIYYHQVENPGDRRYSGKYQQANDIQSSRLFEDF